MEALGVGSTEELDQVLTGMFEEEEEEESLMHKSEMDLLCQDINFEEDFSDDSAVQQTEFISLITPPQTSSIQPIPSTSSQADPIPSTSSKADPIPSTSSSILTPFTNPERKLSLSKGSDAEHLSDYSFNIDENLLDDNVVNMLFTEDGQQLTALSPNFNLSDFLGEYFNLEKEENNINNSALVTEENNLYIFHPQDVEEIENKVYI